MGNGKWNQSWRSLRNGCRTMSLGMLHALLELLFCLAFLIKAKQSVKYIHKQIYSKQTYSKIISAYSHKDMIQILWKHLTHTHTIMLHANNMLLKVNSLCIWSIPSSNSEHFKLGALSGCLRVPVATNLCPPVSFRCLKPQNEYRWVKRLAHAQINGLPNRIKTAARYWSTSIKHWFRNTGIMLRLFGSPVM